MDKLKNWWKAHKPSQRKWIQLYCALLYNANVKGFAEGQIYQGSIKNVCVPGFNCYSCPGAIGSCPLGSLQNAMASSGARFPAYVLGLLALFGLTLGRVICGFLCPLGWIQELLHKIPTPKLHKNRYTKVLSYLKYVILGLFVLWIPLSYAAQSLPLPAFCKYICPAGTFEGAIGLLSNPANADKLGILNILFTRKFVILVALAVGSVFIYRIFCRFICPLGAIYSLFCKVALLGVQVDSTKCTDCGLCVNSCPVDIRRVGDHECIQCGKCIGVCPTKAISWKGSKRIGRKAKTLRVIAWCTAIALLVGVIVWVNQPAAAVQPTTTEATADPVSTTEDDLPVGFEVGMRAPDFTLTTYGGENFKLSEKRGKVVIVNFWATWCAGCVRELPFFEQVWQEYHDQVEVLAIHSVFVTDDPEGYLAKQSYQMPFALDADGSIFKSFGGKSAYPMTAIIDQNGVIVFNQDKPMTYDLLVSQIHPLLEAGLK